MSLLLLFPSQVATTGGGFSCWSAVTTSSSPWDSATGFRDTWGEWQDYTWGQLFSSGVTWSYLSGQIFSSVVTQATTWNNVTTSTCGEV